MSDLREFEEDDREDHSHDDIEDDEDEDENDVGRNFLPSASTLSSPGIPAPAFHDVICGRGKMTSSHPGNRKLRDLVVQRKPEYQRAKRRDQKTSITSEIVQTLRETGSNFLLFDHTTCLWYDVGDEYAKEKGHRRTKVKILKKTVVRKTEKSPAIDSIVHKLLNDQQTMLQAMMRSEMNRSESMNSGRDLATDEALPVAIEKI